MRKISSTLLVLLSAITLYAQPQLRADNIDSVLSVMSIREKATLVVGNGWGSMFEGFHIPFCKGHKVPGAAGETRALPQYGIPSIVFSDGPAGVRIKDEGATAFPVGIALASTRDTALLAEVGRAIGEEAWFFGIDVMLMPGMNIMRSPLCGRNYEYFSEDPLVSGTTAAALIRGVQAAGVGTSVKHYALNNQETNRFHNNVVVDSATMHDIYLENFRIAINESNPWTLMSSYNKVNGTHVQEHPYLLTDVLRQQWHYEGVSLTDWTLHKKPAAKIAAGTDLLMPGWKSKITRICNAVKRGELSEERLTEAARRVLELVVKTHTFQGDTLPSFSLEEHEAIARRAAAAGCVLLKNNNATLPLLLAANVDSTLITNGNSITAQITSDSIVNGNSRQPNPTIINGKIALFGAHSYSLLAGGTGSGYVNCRHRIALSTGLEAAGFEIDSTLAAEYAAYMKRPSSRIHIGGMSIVSKYMGQPSYREKNISLDTIRMASYRTDAAIITIGRQAGEGGDRYLAKGDFYLTDNERMLIEDVCSAYHAFGKKVIVILNIAGVIETASWKDLPDAILLAWCPGQEGGYAIADLLSGVVSPTGKLPITFPIHYEDLPSSENFPTKRIGKSVYTTHYDEKDAIGHRFFTTHPNQPVAFPFGYGLSY